MDFLSVSFDFLHDHYVDAESAKICAVKSELAKENKAFVRLKKNDEIS